MKALKEKAERLANGEQPSSSSGSAGTGRGTSSSSSGQRSSSNNNFAAENESTKSTR